MIGIIPKMRQLNETDNRTIHFPALIHGMARIEKMHIYYKFDALY